MVNVHREGDVFSQCMGMVVENIGELNQEFQVIRV